MFDRYDPRPAVDRERSGLDRARCGRAGTDRPGIADGETRIFSRDVDLPLGDERQLVRVRDRDYHLDERDVEALATVGAFRVVDAEDLPGRALEIGRAHSRRGHSPLEASGLLERVRVDHRGGFVVALTAAGRELLEHHRDSAHAGARQAFYAGVRKPRELAHDREVYRAYRQLEPTLRARGATVRRVVLDYELKRDYQQFLQTRNRGRADSDGRPDRTADEIAAWARAQALFYEDGHVRFPDARVEIQEADGRRTHEDLEVITRHYRGAHAARAGRAGLRVHHARGSGLAGGRGGGAARAGRGHRRGLADEVMR